MRELLRPIGAKTNLAGVRRRASWLVLWLGFGGLLISIVGAAGVSLAALGRVRDAEGHIRKAFLERLSALDQIRSQIYLSGTYVRDFLLSPDPSTAAAQSQRLATLEHETRDAIGAYRQRLEELEREPFLTLQAEIDDYWSVLDRTVAWTPEERNQKRDAFFYDELVPRRTAMLQIADRIALVNERGLNRARRTTARGVAADLRRTLLVTFGITLGRGFVLALLTIGYTLRLERELERRLEENAGARADLQELSARLVRAQENERRTLARELHDEVGQSLSAILMEADNAECAEEPEEIREHLAAVNAWRRRPSTKFATWRCCCGLPCWTISAWFPRSTGMRGKCRNAPDSMSWWTPTMTPTICPTSTKPASTAWCRRR